LHFDELSLFRLSQPLLPCEQLRRCHTPGMAKCRYALSARQLLGHQTSPSRPQLRTAFSHAYKVTHTHAAFKMGFRYRSPNSRGIPRRVRTRCQYPRNHRSRPLFFSSLLFS
jgi:hypothetical protein